MAMAAPAIDRGSALASSRGNGRATSGGSEHPTRTRPTSNHRIRDIAFKYRASHNRGTLALPSVDDKKTILFHGGQAATASGAAASQKTVMATPSARAPQPSPVAPPAQHRPPAPSPHVPASAPAPSPYPAGPPSGPPPVGHQQIRAYNPGRGGISKTKIYGVIGGAMALAVLGVVGSIVKNKVFGPKTARGAISYAALDLDRKSPHVDQVIGALESYSRRRWRRDATWWSLNVYGVRPDGTVEIGNSGGGAIVRFVSASKVQAASKRGRKDSIKEYKLTPRGVKSDKIISAKKPWKGFEPLPTPGCKIADLVAALGKKGFTDGTVRISFDPKFNFAATWSWRVFAKGKPYEGYYSMDSCAFSKRPPK